MQQNPADNISNVSIGNEGNKTPEEVWKIGNEIWEKYKKECQAKGIKQNNHRELDSMLRRYQEEHKDFHQAYPTVLRHMVQEGNYTPKAFKKYLDHLSKKVWTNDEERLDSYTDYAVILFKEVNKKRHLNATEIGHFKRDYRERIGKEHEDFVKRVKEVQGKVEQEEKELDEAKRKDLLSVFERIARNIEYPEEKIKQVISLVETGILSTLSLEELIHDLKAIDAGEANYEAIKEAKEKKQKHVINELKKDN